MERAGIKYYSYNMKSRVNTCFEDEDFTGGKWRGSKVREYKFKQYHIPKSSVGIKWNNDISYFRILYNIEGDENIVWKSEAKVWNEYWVKKGKSTYEVCAKYV